MTVIQLLLGKIRRYILTNQQYGISLSERVELTIRTNAFIRPAATQSHNLVSGIAMHF